MAQITREQVLSIIKRNARDFWTIVEENYLHFVEFKKNHRVDLMDEHFASLCVSQFIELKKGKNFGAVKIQERKKKPPKEESGEKSDYAIRDPESPMTDPQKNKIEQMITLPGAVKLVNQYLHNMGIEGGWEAVNKGQASDIIKILLQRANEINEKKKGGE